MSGKGSRPRPYSVDQKTFDSNWDAIFGKKKLQEQYPSPEYEDNIYRYNEETQEVFRRDSSVGRATD